jgi:hypothetical protein
MAWNAGINAVAWNAGINAVAWNAGINAVAWNAGINAAACYCIEGQLSIRLSDIRSGKLFPSRSDSPGLEADTCPI